MKDLPKVFASPINKHLNNNDEVSKSTNAYKEQVIDISKKINDIFSSYSYVYKADVIITTNEGKTREKVIAKKDNYLITIDNKKIDIGTIKDIEMVNKKTS